MNSAEEEARVAIDVAGTYGIAAVPGDHKALAPPGGLRTKFTRDLVNVLERGVPGGAPVLTVDEVFKAVRAKAGREGMPLPEANNWNEGSNHRVSRV